MRYLNVLAAVAAFLFFALPANAQLSDGIRCVQEQLSAGGYAPGPIDGIAGPQTDGALRRYEADHGAVTSRRLDVTLGNAVCRRIGLNDSSLREFWPSNEGAFDVHFPEGSETLLRAWFNLALPRAEEHVATVFDVELAGRDLIIVGRTGDEVRALVREHYDLGLNSYDFDDLCDVTEGSIGGRAYPGMAVFCVPSARQVPRRRVEFVVAHEVTHLVQFQLAGATPSTHGVQAVVDASGPIWLIEGGAQAFAFTASDRGNYPLWQFRNFEIGVYGPDMPDLSTIEHHGTRETQIEAIYRAGSIAASDLIDVTGFPSHVTFFELLGQGVPWPEAFDAAFKVSVDAFYAHFQAVPRVENGVPINGPLDGFLAP